MVEAMFESFQLVQHLTFNTDLANKQNDHLTIRTECLLVSLSSSKLWEAVLKHPRWQSQLSLCSLAVCAVDAVSKVAGQARFALAELAEMLLALLSDVWVVH